MLAEQRTADAAWKNSSEKSCPQSKDTPASRGHKAGWRVREASQAVTKRCAACPVYAKGAPGEITVMNCMAGTAGLDSKTCSGCESLLASFQHGIKIGREPMWTGTIVGM